MKAEALKEIFRTVLNGAGEYHLPQMVLEKLAGEVSSHYHQLETRNEEFSHIQRELNERIKELNGLFEVSRLIDTPGLTIDELMQSLAELLPSYWQYPEITAVCIRYEGAEYATSNYQRTSRVLTADILAGGQKRGMIEICYLEERPEVDGTPFLREEKNMLEAILKVLEQFLERQMVEKALKESEERWIYALEGAGDGVWDWDLKHNRLFFSDQWKRMLGHEPYEITNELFEWESRLHPDDLKSARETIQAYLNGNVPEYYSEQRLRHKSGGYRWILDRGKVISTDETGKPLRFIGTHTDITDRKQAELQLQIIRFGIENARIGVYQVEEDGTIAYVNAYACRSLGYTREELTGMSLFNVDLQFNPEAFRKHRLKVREKGSRTIFSSHKRRDGSVFPVEVTINYFDYAGKRLSFSFVRDITREKEAEDQLRKLKDALEVEVEAKTKELKERVAELERFREATIDREYRIKELRDEIERLKATGDD